MYTQRLQRFNQSAHWQRMASKVIETLYPRNPKSLLDFGCGIGTFGELAGKTLNCSVVGVDKDPDLLRHVRGRKVQIDDWRLPFLRESFDAVTCIHAISHVKNPGIVLWEIKRVLAPGGIAVFVVPNQVFDVLMAPYNVLTGYRGDPTIRNHWTKEEFQDLLRREGFDPICCMSAGESVKWLPPSNRLRAWFIAVAGRAT